MEPISKTTATVEMEEFTYDNVIVRNFAIASIVFGIVGMLVGVLIAFQLAFRPSILTFRILPLVDYDHCTPTP